MGSREINQSQLEQLYAKYENEIRSVGLAHVPPLFHDDVDRILNTLVSNLPDFKGTTEAEFLAWGNSRVEDAAERLEFFYELFSKYEKSVYAGIWQGLKNALEPSRFDDYEELVQELANEVWLWVSQHLDEFITEGTAKLSTRLQSLGWRFGSSWRDGQLVRGKALVHRFDKGKVPAWLLASQIEAERVRKEERMKAQADSAA